MVSWETLAFLIFLLFTASSFAAVSAVTPASSMDGPSLDTADFNGFIVSPLGDDIPGGPGAGGD